MSEELRESITFDTATSTIRVSMLDGEVFEYMDRNTYLADWPSRSDDCNAMQWS